MGFVLFIQSDRSLLWSRVEVWLYCIRPIDVSEPERWLDPISEVTDRIVKSTRTSENISFRVYPSARYGLTHPSERSSSQTPTPSSVCSLADVHAEVLGSLEAEGWRAAMTYRYWVVWSLSLTSSRLACVFLYSLDDVFHFVEGLVVKASVAPP
ncbi:hypothetical protein ONZ45_g5845 [Pleurotus djamor]|nr:hypothetical protein ONZ45_g5845 [Pleurotus djamor]